MSRSFLRAALAAVSALGAASAATAGPSGPAGGGATVVPPAKIVRCPPVLHPHMQLATPVVPWTAGDASFPVTLDPLNAPRVEGGKLICYYAMGASPAAFVIWQNEGARKCTANKQGFVCMS